MEDMKKYPVNAIMTQFRVLRVSAGFSMCHEYMLNIYG